VAVRVAARGLRAWLRLFPLALTGDAKKEGREIEWRVGGRSKDSRVWKKKIQRRGKLLRSERKRWGG